MAVGMVGAGAQHTCLCPTAVAATNWVGPKPRYVNLVIDDLKGIMEYKKGSTQYVSRTLKRADNAKLYQ